MGVSFHGLALAQIARDWARLPSEMRWLVTGATGFFGSALSRALHAQGEELVLQCREPSRIPEELRTATTVATVSLGDPNGLAELAKGCDVAVHAAAVHHPESALRALRWVNIAGTENVLNACSFAAVKRLVYISCADITLHNQSRVHWDETRSGRPPIEPHGETKRLAEDLVLARNADGIETVSIRPARLWGPGDRTWLPELVKEARANGGIQLAGGGANLVSVAYVEHVVDAVISAAQVPEAAGETFYVTDNEFLDAREFFGALSKTFGLPEPRRGAPFPLAYAAAGLRKAFRLGGLSHAELLRRGKPTFFNIHSALKTLGYEPRITLEEGMQRWHRWTEEQGGLETLVAHPRLPTDAASVDAIVSAAGGD